MDEYLATHRESIESLIYSGGEWRRIVTGSKSGIRFWIPPKPLFQVVLRGRTNISYNCIDRHLDGANRNKAAIIWEGEPGEQRVLTYFDLYRDVCKFATWP